MDSQQDDQRQQAQHHDLGDALQALLQAEGADGKTADDRDGHEKAHLGGIGQHGPEDRAGVGSGLKAAAEELDKIAEHPAGDRGVIHHEQIAARDGEPAVDVPFLARLLQRLVAQHSALAGGAANGQLHGEDGHAHDDEKEQIEQNKDAAAVLAGDKRKFPDIADADGAAGADQNKAEAGFEILAFHGKTSQMNR